MPFYSNLLNFVVILNLPFYTVFRNYPCLLLEIIHAYLESALSIYVKPS